MMGEQRNNKKAVCPFCGKEAELFIMFHGDVVGCEYCGIQIKRTNGDRIRSMTDEELAEFLCDIIVDRYIGVTAEGWVEWLKEAKEGE